MCEGECIFQASASIGVWHAWASGWGKMRVRLGASILRKVRLSEAGTAMVLGGLWEHMVMVVHMTQGIVQV